MHQTIDAAVQTNKDAKIGNRFDLTGDFVAFLEDGSKSFPWIRNALFDTERNTTTLCINVQHHYFNIVAQLDNFGWVDVFVGPIHFGNVDQTFNTWFDFNESAVIGHIRNLTKHARIGRITTGNVIPWIFAQLFQAKADAVTFAVIFENADLELFANVNHF